MPAIALPAGKVIVDGILIVGGLIIGAIVLASIADRIADYIAKELSDAIARARECRNCDCPECDPPKGTVGVQVHFVPPSRPHAPCAGSHVHFLIRNQNPNGCVCFWDRNPRRVMCLDDADGPDDFDPSSLGPGIVVL